jgi:hypothetical protein
LWIIGVVVEVLAPQIGANFGAAQREAHVPRVAGRDGINSQATGIASSL